MYELQAADTGRRRTCFHNEGFCAATTCTRLIHAWDICIRWFTCPLFCCTAITEWQFRVWCGILTYDNEAGLILLYYSLQIFSERQGNYWIWALRLFRTPSTLSLQLEVNKHAHNLCSRRICGWNRSVCRWDHVDGALVIYVDLSSRGKHRQCLG